MHEQCTCKPSMGCQHHTRRFLTKEEKIKQLENYVEDLKKEIAAVNEKIKELQNTN
jgi:prefoldin subunit 5